MSKLPELEKFLIFDCQFRVCLRSDAWNKLWELLPDRKRVGRGWEPALPLILDAWYETSDKQKRARFIEHLDWAHKHGVEKEILAYLKSLPEEAWLRTGQRL